MGIGIMGFIQKFPGGMFGEDTLRLNIYAYKIKQQNLMPKDINHIDRGGILYTWSLVAPTNIQENIQHTWEEYHSFQGRAAQLRSDAIAAITRGSQVVTGPSRYGGNTDAAKAKVDSPIVYTGSERLEYNFLVPFMRYEGGAYKDVFEPIFMFKKYSCASIGGAIDTIDFPAIFQINTTPADYIYIEYAALTNVQVTYEAPYIGGYPQKAECTLTFRDIRPLYRESWRTGAVGGIVTTGVI
jgi:hypothetical protein